MIMTKRELIDALTYEYHNTSYDYREDELYYYFKKVVFQDVVQLIKISTSPSMIKSNLIPISCGRIPYSVKLIIDEFLAPFEGKTDDEIRNNKELNDVISERIYRLDQTVGESKENNKLSEVAASKIKKDKNNDKDKKKSTNVDFDIFNTF